MTIAQGNLAFIFIILLYFQASNSPGNLWNGQLSRPTTPELDRGHQQQQWRLGRPLPDTQLLHNYWNEGNHNRKYYRRQESRRYPYMYQTNMDTRVVQHKKLRRWFSLSSNSFNYWLIFIYLIQCRCIETVSAEKIFIVEGFKKLRTSFCIWLLWSFFQFINVTNLITG